MKARNLKYTAMTACLAAGFLSLPIGAAAAVNAYLLIDGVSGESASRKGSIDVLSFSWGVSNPGVAATAGATGAVKVVSHCQVSDLSIMKVLDATSPKLVESAATGKAITSITLTYSKAGAQPGAASDYFVMKLTDVHITSVQLSGSNENPTESVSFHAGQVQGTYKGLGTPAASPPAWNIAPAKGCQ